MGSSLRASLLGLGSVALLAGHAAAQPADRCAGSALDNVDVVIAAPAPESGAVGEVTVEGHLEGATRPHRVELYAESEDEEPSLVDDAVVEPQRAYRLGVDTEPLPGVVATLRVVACPLAEDGGVLRGRADATVTIALLEEPVPVERGRPWVGLVTGGVGGVVLLLGVPFGVRTTSSPSSRTTSVPAGRDRGEGDGWGPRVAGPGDGASRP